MIKANELRIGNYVKADNAKIWAEEYNGTIVKVDIDEFKDIYFNDNYYSPIPLTAEILERCGFKNAYSSFHDEIFIYNLRGEQLHFQWQSEYDKGMGVSYPDKDDAMMFPCKYLHQLQNLYFALTGEELTVNL